MGKRQRFTKEVKLEAVRLFKRYGRTAAEVADQVFLWSSHLDNSFLFEFHYSSSTSGGEGFGRQREAE